MKKRKKLVRSARKARRAKVKRPRGRNGSWRVASAAVPKTLPPELVPVRDAMVDAIDEGESSSWKLGHLINESAPQIEAKYPSLNVFYKEVILRERPDAPSYSTVTLDARVAAVWGPEFASLGMSKLGVAIAWCSAMQLKPPADPRSLKFPVPTEGGTVEKTFDQCSREDIRHALEALTQPDVPTMPPAVRAVTHKLMAAIQAVDEHGPAHINVKLNGPEPILDIAGLSFSHIRDYIGEMYLAMFPPPGTST